MHKNMFVAIEGLDRSGKTTLLRKMKKTLEEDGYAVLAISYPNRQNKTGKIINEILEGSVQIPREAVHLLFSANRWEDSTKIEAYVEEEENRRVILCDRYTLSGIAYSIANGVDESFALASDKGIVQPDMTLFLDVPPEVIVQRDGFGNEIYERKEIQKRVYDAMKKHVKRYKHSIIESADIETMHRRMIDEVKREIRQRKEESTKGVDSIDSMKGAKNK